MAYSFITLNFFQTGFPAARLFFLYETCIFCFQMKFLKILIKLQKV